ncbi:hypothetical protein C8J57DRAFT_1497652 [Mycena rebaudengoi]|nr:hypothetical protein C8J57DRAFT_1497652 [Mycena rebaudengoi]
MASTEPVVLETPSIVLFDHALVAKQRHSLDLVIYCPSLRFTVKITYPTVNGHRLPPGLLVQYLQRIHKLWPCFCSENEERSVSCLIKSTPEGVFARYHYQRPRCSFFLDLTKIYASATLKADYKLENLATLTDPLTNAPYLKGYIGETGTQAGGKYQIFGTKPSMSLDVQTEDDDIGESNQRSVGVQTWE